MDEAHLAAAVRYVALNPVKAKMVKRAEDWPWPSVRAHLAEEDDGLVTVAPILQRYGRFAEFMGEAPDAEAVQRLQRAETIGRPVGDADWLEQMEERSGKRLRPRKRGPKVKG
ncbi:hypothetical protein [Alterisphingorhabdus coralli]|uniref:Transposase n=1 Tax=Alterisphingorhabdus coralli TaxID=3071408 RepID=A0AA97HZK2_9SPHN|nr:hypothetical protein [Parasphingorhabdus sp. SCSIO 66989]WOE74794.1 hypothetical protein RB602_13245 [Parasphingorhabdus sp. SCSIO 66989]